MTKKAEMTKVEALDEVLVILNGMNEAGENAELIEKVEAMKAQEVKTREKAKIRRAGETKAAKANKAIAEEISNWFAEEADAEVAYAASEIAEIVEIEATPQKMTAIMKYVAGVEKVDKATNIKGRVGYVKSV